MKHLFIDVNVILDYLTDREPFSTDAANIFELAEQGKIRLFTAAVSFNLTYYILRKRIGHKSTLKVLEDLAFLVTISDVTQDVIKNALKSDRSDFEDAIQYYTALSNPEIQAIITRDKLGFKNSNVAVFTPTDILRFIDTET